MCRYEGIADRTMAIRLGQPFHARREPEQGAEHTVCYRSSLCCCRRLSLIVRMISNSRRTSAFSSSVQGCRVPSGAIQWQTSASSLMIFCQSLGRLGILRSSSTKATLAVLSQISLVYEFNSTSETVYPARE
jgi:hypothetical protein